MSIHPRILAIACVAGLIATSCSTKQEISVGGVPLESTRFDAEWVRKATTTTRRGDKIVFSGPVLQRTQIVDPESGNAPGRGETGVQTARSGYLFAEQSMKSGEFKYYCVFQWDLIEGQNRYTRVALPDGRALPFQVGSTAPSDPSSPSAFPVFQTLVIEVPEAVLRLVPPSGLRLTITLDDGTSFAIGAPQAYVRGFTQAVGAGG